MKESPSILFFGFDYPPETGGISRLCAQIVEGLKRFTQINVLTGKEVRGAPGTAVPDVPTTRVFAKRPARELIALWKLIFTFTQEDIVFCNIWYPEGLIALISTIFRKRPVVIMTYAYELLFEGSEPKRSIRAFLRKAVLSRCDLVIAISEYTLDLTRKAGGSAQAVAIPLAVDTEHFRPRSDLGEQWNDLKLDRGHTLLSVARIDEYKGFETVFKALAEIKDGRQYQYLIAGTGRDREKLEDKARSYGIEEQVKWLGFVEESELPRLYSRCDLFLLCSIENLEKLHVEGFGLVLLEAQACGVPVIGTRNGGVPEAMAEGETGWLIDCEDHKSLAGLLSDLFDNPEKMAQAGKRARERALAECQWDQYTQKVWEALTDHL